MKSLNAKFDVFTACLKNFDSYDEFQYMCLETGSEKVWRQLRNIFNVSWNENHLFHKDFED